VLPTSVAIIVICALAIGPTRREWILLGHHRLRGMWHRTGEARRI
jgi:hypothetical protein